MMLIYTFPIIFIIIVIILKIYMLIINKNCKSKMSLVGKTALVTGGSSGIGYQIVLNLAQRGCRVIIADVLEDKNLLEKIFKETHSTNIVFKNVDLSSFSSVRGLAKFVIRNEEKLDILINNAGTGNAADITEDGLDKVMQVNYFSAFLLTHLVLDLLKKARGRILFTSSVTCYINNFSLEKLHIENMSSRDHIFNYSNSKLCLIMVSNVFAKKLKPYGVTCNTYHPGVASTNIFYARKHHKTPVFNAVSTAIFAYLAHFIAQTPDEAAQTAIYLACANEVENVTGEFFFEMKPTYKPMAAKNKEMCDELWQVTEEIVKLRHNEKL